MSARRTLKLVFFLVMLFGFVWSSTGTATAGLSVEEEKELGEKFLKAVLQQVKLIEDQEVISFVNTVGQRVVEQLDILNFPYHFYVVDSSALNAFAAPAGHVFMNRGLIEIMDDEGELAAILAHEIAHVQSRHIAQRMARAQKISLAALGGMLAGLFLGGDAGAAVIAGSQAGAATAMLSYSRQNEEESDRKGLRYLESAGYDGMDFVNIMRKMGQESWKAGGRIPTYLSTHPGVPERVAYLATTVESRRRTSKSQPQDREGFILMQAKLFGGYEDRVEAEGKFQDWLGQAETKAMAFYGIGLLQRRQRKMDEAVESFKNALALRPDLAPILVELGETYFQMGQFDKATSVLMSALTLQPDQPMALFVLGRCRLEQNHVADASRQLARAAQLNDRLPAIHYHLGIAYGRMKRLANAHYHFGIHYQREGSVRNAQFHFQEALRHADSPQQKEAIRKELEGANYELRQKQREERTKSR